MIDECQMVSNASVKWRAKMLELVGMLELVWMLELVQMMDKRVQMIFFTATKRPKDEEELFGLVGLKEDGIERGGSGEIEGEDNKGKIGYLVKEY